MKPDDKRGSTDLREGQGGPFAGKDFPVATAAQNYVERIWDQVQQSLLDEAKMLSYGWLKKLIWHSFQAGAEWGRMRQTEIMESKLPSAAEVLGILKTVEDIDLEAKEDAIRAEMNAEDRKKNL